MIRLLRGVSIVALVAAVLLYAAALARDWMSQDHTMPTITAASETLEIPCEYTPEQLLEGMSAFDEVDGDLTSEILLGNFSRFLEPGVCDLNYIVFDSANHMATLTRRVTFTDYHSPRFSLAAPLCFGEESTTNLEVRELFSATDLLDGDLTEWITYVESDASFSTAGDYTMTMEVTNSFGDTVSYAFPVHIYERGTQNVSISLEEPLVYLDQGDTFDPEDYVSSVTDQGGNHYSVAQLDITSTVDPDTPGIYEVHYEFGQDPDTHFGAEQGTNQYGEMWLTVIVQEVRE